jgi:hypothetical protein
MPARDCLVALFLGGRVRVLFVLHCFVLLACLLAYLLALPIACCIVYNLVNIGWHSSITWSLLVGRGVRDLRASSAD